MRDLLYSWKLDCCSSVIANVFDIVEQHEKIQNVANFWSVHGFLAIHKLMNEQILKHHQIHVWLYSCGAWDRLHNSILNSLLFSSLHPFPWEGLPAAYEPFLALTEALQEKYRFLSCQGFAPAWLFALSSLYQHDLCPVSCFLSVCENLEFLTFQTSKYLISHKITQTGCHFLISLNISHNQSFNQWCRIGFLLSDNQTIRLSDNLLIKKTWAKC